LADTQGNVLTLNWFDVTLKIERE